MYSFEVFRIIQIHQKSRKLAPVFKDETLTAAEALPPSSINVPTHINNVGCSTTLLAALACKETTEIDSFGEEHEDPKVDQGSKEILGFEPTSLATSSTLLPNHNAWEKTKPFLTIHLIKLRDAASAAEKHELPYEFVRETVRSFGKSGKPALVPSSIPLKDDDNEDNYKPFCQNQMVPLSPIMSGELPCCLEVVFIPN